MMEEWETFRVRFSCVAVRLCDCARTGCCRAGADRAAAAAGERDEKDAELGGIACESAGSHAACVVICRVRGAAARAPTASPPPAAAACLCPRRG